MTSGVAAAGDTAAEGTPTKRDRGRPSKSKKRDAEGHIKDEGEATPENGKNEADAKDEREDAATGGGAGNVGDDEKEVESEH